MRSKRIAAGLLTWAAAFATGCHGSQPAPAARGAGSAGSGGEPAGVAAAGAAAIGQLPLAGIASKTGCSLDALPLRRPMPQRLVAIGDVHGDLAALRGALRAAGAIGDADDHWIGGALTIVQTGDVLDRGDDEPAMLELLAHLAEEAPKSGGAVIELLGNHELMNAAGDFRYVTPGAATAFGDRAAAFRPGGPWARRLAAYDTVAIVGDTVFAHGGVTPAWAARVDELNGGDRCWLAGERPDEPTGATAEDGPVWTRDYGGAQVDCAEVGAALAALGAKRMVVGHTVQAGGINSQCEDKLWRIDVGMTKVFGGPIQVLELTTTGEPRVLHGSR